MAANAMAVRSQASPVRARASPGSGSASGSAWRMRAGSRGVLAGSGPSHRAARRAAHRAATTTTAAITPTAVMVTASTVGSHDLGSGWSRRIARWLAIQSR